jgi:hypothetical protein
VVFTLDSPFEPFMQMFHATAAAMVPKHLYEDTDYRNNPAKQKAHRHRPIPVHGMATRQLYPPDVARQSGWLAASIRMVIR